MTESVSTESVIPETASAVSAFPTVRVPTVATCGDTVKSVSVTNENADDPTTNLPATLTVCFDWSVSETASVLEVVVKETAESAVNTTFVHCA